MNIRGAAGGATGCGSPTDVSNSATLVEVGRKMLAMEGLRSAYRTTGPSPVSHNGRYWTPDRHRENAETVRYIQCLVQTCEAIKPWTVGNRTQPSLPRSKITIDQLPRIMQKVLGNKIRNNRDYKFVSYWTPSDFVKNCLFWHNFYRHFHRSSELVISPQLCEDAQSWANHLAHTDTFAYQNKISYGQNIFCRKALDRTTEIEGKDVVREWYSASKMYKPRKNPKMYPANINSGPFTQLIWSNTKELGIGKACSRSGRIIVVANYLPKGNVNGQYVNNVHINQYFLPINKKKLDAVSRYIREESTDKDGQTMVRENVY